MTAKRGMAGSGRRALAGGGTGGQVRGSSNVGNDPLQRERRAVEPRGWRARVALGVRQGGTARWGTGSSDVDNNLLQREADEQLRRQLGWMAGSMAGHDGETEGGHDGETEGGHGGGTEGRP